MVINEHLEQIRFQVLNILFIEYFAYFRKLAQLCWSSSKADRVPSCGVDRFRKLIQFQAFAVYNTILSKLFDWNDFPQAGCLEIRRRSFSVNFLGKKLQKIYNLDKTKQTKVYFIQYLDEISTEYRYRMKILLSFLWMIWLENFFYFLLIENSINHNSLNSSSWLLVSFCYELDLKSTPLQFD